MRTLLVGIAIMIAGATAVRAQTRDTVIFGLPLYNRDEAVKKQCEEAAPKPAVSKSACMAAAAKKEKDARDLTLATPKADISITRCSIANCPAQRVHPASCAGPCRFSTEPER
jgi:hypothetical protein